MRQRLDAARVGLPAVGELLAAAFDIAECHDGLEVLRVLRDHALENLDRFVAAVHTVEIGGELNLRVALQRRSRRHTLVDLDRHLRLLDRLVEIGERQQCERMVRRKMERQLQIDQREIFAAAPDQRGADAVERLGAAGLCGIDQRRHLLAGPGFAQAFLNQRMARELLVERLVDRGRLCIALVARQPARIGLRHAQHRVVELVGPLIARTGVLFLAGQFENHAGM